MWEMPDRKSQSRCKWVRSDRRSAILRKSRNRGTWRRLPHRKPDRMSAGRHRSGQSDRKWPCHRTWATDRRSVSQHRRSWRRGMWQYCSKLACYRRSAAYCRSGTASRSADRSTSAGRRRSMIRGTSPFHRRTPSQGKCSVPGRSLKHRRTRCRRMSTCPRTTVFVHRSSCRGRMGIPAWSDYDNPARHRRWSARCRSRCHRTSPSRASICPVKGRHFRTGGARLLGLFRMRLG